MAEIDAYKRWLASAMTDTAIVTGIEVAHPNIGTMYLVNWPEELTLRDETATDRVHLPARFDLAKVGVNDTTEQATTLRISNISSAVYETLRALTFEQRRSPVTLTERLYFHNDPTTLLINPPMQWVIHQLSVGFQQIECELRTEPLRGLRIGRYYTRREFEILRYL